MESITLLDCNNKQSSQVLGGNKKSSAIFTNKLGSGITVEPGDKVSVHNAFISEIGSDANAIQITDEFLENRSFTYTQITNHVKVNGSNHKLLGYERQTASNITSTEEIKSNKFSLLINYYKTNNGENHFNLPRLFEHKDNANNIDVWEKYDEITYGYINGSYNLMTNLNASFNGSRTTGYYVDDDVFFFGILPQPERYGLRPKNNNARFQIFINTDTRFGSQSETLDNLYNASFSTVANLDYIPYIEKLDIDLPAGFKSPDEIADLITNKLTAQSQPQVNFYRSKATNSINGVSASLTTDKSLNVEINSPTYHTFYAASPFSSNKNQYDALVSAVNGSTAFNNNANTYLSQYQYIGVKRPELWIKGREWADYYKNYLNQTTGDPNYARVNTAGAFFCELGMSASQFSRDAVGTDEDPAHTIVLSLEWKREHLEKLNAIFMEQRNHPELFENKYTQLNGFTTVNNSRFLHMNALSVLSRRNLNTEFERTLGCDYFMPNASNIRNLNSVPLFFDFNPTYENKYTEGDSWESGYAFGCFKRYTRSDKDFISVTTSHLGIIEDTSLNASFTTIPNNLFTLNNASSNTEIFRTMIGWDVNFNSYGNVCIGITDGYLDKPKNTAQINQQYPTQFNTTEIDSYNYVQKIYLGANEPKLEYNNVSNRFELSELHTTERIQNRFNAGGVDATAKHDTEIVPTFSTAGDKVYKINKRLFDTNWTTSMMPYKSNRITSLSVDGQDYQVDFLNPNLSPWTIYDQLSGIIIKDFGYSENTWNNGFWGRLGFEYNQFNSSRTSENDLTSRVGNNNKSALPYAFTNANVGQTATMDFITNVFSAGMYSLQLPLTTSFNASNHGGNATLYFRDTLLFEQFPAISENASSVKLTAPNLPQKLVNPYYTIRSDILDSSDYIGGADSGEIYPVIAVVPKISDYPDFFVNTSTDMEFVFTKSKTITDITTSIHNPDQSLADVNDGSAVIYKIKKQIPDTNFNIVQQILNEKK